MSALNLDFGQTALYEAPMESVFKFKAGGNYVDFVEATGTYRSKAASVLPAEAGEIDASIGVPYVTATNEEDISARLPNRTTPAYTLPIGVAWDTGEMTSLFCFDKAVVEYRESIGRPGTKPTATGKPACYMVTYACIGIPEPRFAWLQARLEEIKLPTVLGERDTRNRGYVWINANITANYTVPLIMRTESGATTVLDTPTKNLMTAMRNARKSFMGVVGVEITLKRPKTFDVTGARQLSLSLKSVQAYDITDLSSPPLAKATTFEAVKTTASNRLVGSILGKPETPTDGMLPLGAEAPAM